MNRKVIVIFIASFLYFLVFLNASLHAQPTQEQLKALRSIKTVRIEVEQSYSGIITPDRLFENTVKRIMGYAGLKTVDSDTKSCDAVIRVKAKGESLEAKYIGCGKLKTGACLEGEISIEAKGIIYKKNFSGMICPPTIVNVRRDTSPFTQVFGRFSECLVHIVKEVYGSKPLIAALKDCDSFVRATAASALGEVKDIKAVEPLIAVLKDNSSSVRSNAAYALGKIKDTRAVEPLIAALKDNYNAAIALGEIGDARAVEPLVKFVEKDKMPSNRVKAFKSLSQMGTLAVEPLIAVLKNKDDDIRYRAAMALGEIKDKRVIAPLTTALKGNDLAVIGGAHRFFIRKGIQGSEASLIRALDKYYDLQMLKNFVYCGNQQLADTSRSWAKSKGVTVPQSAKGEDMPQWGSDL